MSEVKHLRAVPGTGEPTTAALPHDIGAEQVVLGAAMLSPAALTQARAHLADDGAEFYRPAHARIWQAIIALADAGAPHDPLAVGAALGRDLERTGGAPYLHTLLTHVPVAAQVGYYAHRLATLAHARSVAQAGLRLTQAAHAAATDPDLDLRGLVASELAALARPDAHGWEEPTPLTSTPELPAFPHHALPDWLAAYVAALAEATQTPLDLPGCLALACLAVAAAGRIWVHTGTWTEPTCLYVAVALPPGTRKSEVFRHLVAPLRQAEKTLAEAARPLIAEAVLTRRIAEAHAETTARAAEHAATTGDPDATQAALAEATQAALNLEAATIPATPRLFAEDATMERLASLLASHHGAFAVLSAEGEIFALAAGRYGGTPNLGVLKAAHAGESLRIDRVGRPPELIEAATLTLGVCTQPGVLARLGDTPQFREQGLLGRILYALPDAHLGYRNPTPTPLPDPIAATYHTTLATLAVSLHELTEPATLTLTPSARHALTGLLADIEPRLRPHSGDLAHMSDWAGKLTGATVRIAALLHLAHHARDGWDQPIEATTLAAAAELGDYFTAHAKAAYDTIGADPAVSNARVVLDWLRHAATTRFTARDLMRGPLKNRISKVTETEPVLRVLETHGWIRRLPAPPRPSHRPPATAYETHPTLTQNAR